MPETGRFRFSIDRGGTFTDVYAECPDGKVRVMKLLSEDPVNYPDAPREAIRRILEVSSQKQLYKRSSSLYRHMQLITFSLTEAVVAPPTSPTHCCNIITSQVM